MTADAADLPPRDAMEFDVVVVGAGPAGLAAAIKVKQLAAKTGKEISVVVLEKGSEVGAHILSGAVIDPKGLNALIPDWKEKGAPVISEVTEDRFLYLGPSGDMRLPNFLMPPLMNNHGNYIVSLGQLVRWLGEQATELGVEIYPGFAAVEVLYDDNGAVVGVATGDMGVGARRQAQGQLRARHGIARQVYVHRRRRARLSGQAADHEICARRGPRAAKVRHRHQGAVGGAEGHPPARPRAALVRMAARQCTGGGTFLYHYGDNKVAVGFVLHLNYENPYLDPFKEFQRFKTHPVIRVLSRAASASLTALAPSRRAAGSRSRSWHSRGARCSAALPGS